MFTGYFLRRWPIALAGALALSSQPLFAQQSDVQRANDALGEIAFPISCSAQAQAQFERALALLHHMMYGQAEQEFAAIIEDEPACAMPHWGVAMTLFHPLWPGQPSEQDLAKGTAAIEQAQALDAPSDRERAYIAAAAAFYQDWQQLDHDSRLAVWETAQKQVYEANPDDIDAAALYALSHLATAPKADKTFAHQKAAGELLEQLHARAPRHPAGFHYLIHAYDNPVLAERAVEIARGYDKLAPDVPHALHMPSHIFVRLGFWEDTIGWNRRSADVAKRQPVAGKISLHYAHAIDYLVYAHLQRGEDRAAREALAELDAVENQQDSFGGAYGVAAAKARYPLERARWDEAAALPVRVPDAFTWDNFPAVEAISHFARGLGSARSERADGAREAITTLDGLYQRLRNDQQNYWAVLVDAQRTAVAAWLSYAEGSHGEALQLMHRAAELEDSVDKHPVTPGAVLPARELLGDMLVLADQPDEAIAAYEAALVISPNRFRSLFGAWRAAELSGDLQQAKLYHTRLEELTATADADRPEIKQLRLALARN